MSHDGTIHSEVTTSETSARTIVQLYYSHITSTVSNRDIWQVGDALLRYTESVSSESESSLAAYELLTDARLRNIENKVVQLEDVVAKMIFDLNEIGIDFNFKEIYNFRKQYLKK